MYSEKISSAIQAVTRFSHVGPVITRFEPQGIETPSGMLTLVVRTDTKFATRNIQKSFLLNGSELTQDKRHKVSSEEFNDVVSDAYAEWGTNIVSAWAENLNYDHYNLSPSTTGTHIHFHSADSLAQATIRKAGIMVNKDTDPLFVSLDDMIHEDVFRAADVRGRFAEIGFSRQFSSQGKEAGFVARPGKTRIKEQIEAVRQKATEMREVGGDRIPIIFLEDNVRHARTPLWIINEMQKAGVFENAQVAGIATCFAVASREEREKLRHEEQQIPLVVGVDYTNSLVDVVTPRDHLFDGLVVRVREKLGRVPSFLLAADEIARNFKINPDLANVFRQQVLDANERFCDHVEEETSVVLPLKSFTPGPTISKILGIPEDMPMKQVLRNVRKPLWNTFDLT
jgi:hypothetical protein